ncbi:MAG: beta-lactamase family protein [Bacteroidales bacterium]|nr:MAG: beta-lactamase family protein [Bacteroidales bacterium]
MKKFILLFWLFLPLNSFSQIWDSLAIDSIFSEWNKPNVPGCALGIIKDNKLIYTKGYGMANLEYNIPNTTNSVFRIGSSSKQFTAACIILLEEQGKLDLDDKLGDFFPEFPEYADQITVRHLLNHTSGIRDYLTLALLKGLGDDDFFEDRDVMKLLVNQMDLNFQPGEEYLYSNSGYWLLGQIVNKVAEMNMADFARQEIFEPLGMTSTHFHNNHSQIVKNRASGYAPDGSGGFRISMTTLDMIGDGGIFTTIEDIKKWDDAYYQSDILSESFWSTMLERGVLNNRDTLDYTCGLIKGYYKGLKTISHGGAFVGFRADIVRFPEQKLSVALFANRADANPTSMCYKVADILLKDQLIVQKSTPEDIEQMYNSPEIEFNLEQLSGIYILQPGLTLEINLQNDSLNVVQSWDSTSYKIARTKGNTFQIPGNTDIGFTFSDLQNGSTNQLTILQNGRNTHCKRKENIDLNSIKPEEYVGKYYSKELDVIYEISTKKDKLQVSIGNNEPEEIIAYNADQFSYSFMLLRFQRNDDLITGFEIDAGRVKNLKFKKI